MYNRNNSVASLAGHEAVRQGQRPSGNASSSEPEGDSDAKDGASGALAGEGSIRQSNARNLLPKAVLATGKVDVGEDLESRLRTSGKMSPIDALRYLTALLSALESLHATRQAHGSLSPDLLLVTKGDDGSLRLRLLKNRQPKPTLQDARSASNLPVRTLLYSSPDHIECAAPAATADLYALGLIAYTMLVGEPYWNDEAERLEFVDFCRTIIHGPPEAPSIRAIRRKSVRLPQDFDAWFVLVTSRKHPDRFQNIKDAGAALTSVLSNPESRELSRSFQFKFDASLLQAPAQNTPLPQAPAQNDNLRLTALFAVFASISVAVAVVMALRWTHDQHVQHRAGASDWSHTSLTRPASVPPSSSNDVAAK